MKFSVSSSALLSLLATTGKVISNKNTLPILDYFLMELKGDQLKVTTSDLETTLVGQITVDNVESEGMIAAPAKQLLDSLKEFAEIPLTIDCNDQTFEIKLNWKSGSLSIPGASAVSYPALPALAEDKKELTFDVDTLVNGINKTIFATADDELRPIMNGVYINIEPVSITFVATDAHKLVKYSSEQPSELTAAFILPKKPANLLKGMLLKEEAPVKVSFDSKNVLFNLKNHTLVCRLIEGSYPNYNAVPTRCSSTASNWSTASSAWPSARIRRPTSSAWTSPTTRSTSRRRTSTTRCRPTRRSRAVTTDSRSPSGSSRPSSSRYSRTSRRRLW